MSKEQITIIVATSINIVAVYLAYFKGYRKRKGENEALLEDAREISYEQIKGQNLATKEDIEEITSKVETIKTQLNYQNQSKLSFSLEERQALTDCYSKAIIAIEFAKHYRIQEEPDITTEDYEWTFIKDMSDLKAKYKDYEISFHTLKLYTSEESILSNFLSCQSIIDDMRGVINIKQKQYIENLKYADQGGVDFSVHSESEKYYELLINIKYDMIKDVSAIYVDRFINSSLQQNLISSIRDRINQIHNFDNV